MGDLGISVEEVVVVVEPDVWQMILEIKKIAIKVIGEL